MDTEYKRVAGNLDNSQNLCCDNPEVKEVLDLVSGDVLLAQEAIGSDVNSAMTLRRELARQHKITEDDHLLMICPYCHKPLRLNCHRNGDRFYFAHIQRENNCPQLDKKNWTKERILAAKFNGQKESLPHKAMKEDLRKVLEFDSRFSGIEVEEVVKGEDPSTWRKPDVRALYNGTLHVVFEIQLSTTFLDVILERRDFYREKGELLVWVFNKFSLCNARMMELDTFHANNMNAIVLDQEARNLCDQHQRLCLKCFWVEPKLQDGKLSHSGHSTIIDFEMLNKDVEKQLFYWFDYNSKRAAIAAELKKQAEEVRLQNLKEQFFKSFDPALDVDDLAKHASQFFPEMNLCDNKIKVRLKGYLRMMNAAKTGDPSANGSGWNYTNFKNIYDNVFISHTPLYFLFCCAMKAYGRDETSDSIKERKVEAWGSICSEGKKSKFHHDPIYTTLTEVLFPEAHGIYTEIFARACHQCHTSSKQNAAD
ncbi:DUF6035 family protein [Megalodesulfovibrio gigas]|uniref:Uncharacterized protein n=1 Tax=Megalodesulfovibrio gigas (strain ATCC 19364 / DSM 1382 / NCIMB 9332 / VKM B-1759) TaxID=1121448 RepID=T2GCI7_MEGG1|nr:DUF6035 family protein [Megalodesulfovibrio gigas]AGW13841.1 hypothetical protein DGI_2074 [Megalodesulfovibrio gigas DSM 1382 = ATCC 19364]